MRSNSCGSIYFACLSGPSCLPTRGQLVINGKIQHHNNTSSWMPGLCPSSSSSSSSLYSWKCVRSWNNVTYTCRHFTLQNNKGSSQWLPTQTRSCICCFSRKGRTFFQFRHCTKNELIRGRICVYSSLELQLLRNWIYIYGLLEQSLGMRQVGTPDLRVNYL